MANKNHIIAVLLFSIALVIFLAWWMDFRDTDRPSEVLLEGESSLQGPYAPQELSLSNPAVTNTMNRSAVITTNKGIITLELFEDQMPITTANFIKLAEEGFYNDTKFHRVIDGFMIQGGDPNSKGDDAMSYGTGGPGYTIQDEFVEGELLSNTRGTIAMANTGQPNSGGSQFFINTVDNTALDFNQEPFTSRHPVFGRVVSGLDVVDAISKVQTGLRDVPTDPVVITSIVIQ